MATVTPELVKQLREQTNAGLGACKKALDHSQGDMEKAILYLREQGLAAAVNKAGRVATEGVVSAFVDSQRNCAYLVEINSETDFVSRNESFVEFVESVKAAIVKAGPRTLEEVLKLSTGSGSKIADVCSMMVAKLGENIHIRRFHAMPLGPKGFATAYTHGGGKIGVLVACEASNMEMHSTQPKLQSLIKDVALQVAAAKPQYLNRESVPAKILEEETQIFFQQYKNQGKPEAVLEKIVKSRLETWFKEQVLPEQPFVKDDKMSVGQYLQIQGKDIGLEGLKLTHMMRWELGQGVQKVETDFAKEVADQIAQARH